MCISIFLEIFYKLIYIPIFLSIIISCIVLFQLIIYTIKKAEKNINYNNLVFIILCQLAHYFIFFKSDIYLLLSIILFSLILMLYQYIKTIYDKKIIFVIHLSITFFIILSTYTNILYLFPTIGIMTPQIIKKTYIYIVDFIKKK